MEIKNFIYNEHWVDICDIHDKSRPGELKGSAPRRAFVPLEKCYKTESLLDDKIYVGKVNEEIVGFVALNRSKITWLYVHPSHQKKGYGRKLLIFVISKAEKPTSVIVLNKNLKAIKLYESEGFRIVKSKRGKIPITDVNVEYYEMKK